MRPDPALRVSWPVISSNQSTQGKTPRPLGGVSVLDAMVYRTAGEVAGHELKDSPYAQSQVQPTPPRMISW
jgi:hypothetical protein